VSSKNWYSGQHFPVIFSNGPMMSIDPRIWWISVYNFSSESYQTRTMCVQNLQWTLDSFTNSKNTHSPKI